MKFKRCNYNDDCIEEADTQAIRGDFWDEGQNTETRTLCCKHAKEWVKGYSWISIAYLRPIIVSGELP